VKPEAEDLWKRALQAFATAQSLVHSDPDAAASRAYYAAFHAVSAWFSLSGTTFSRHSAVETAVHRDLVKTGTSPADVGKSYSFLHSLRSTADYGGSMHVSPEEATEAVNAAGLIVSEVRRLALSAGIQLP
jgi:uncharacterized protein (UPF0332 family)